jgi:alanine racemase
MIEMSALLVRKESVLHNLTVLRDQTGASVVPDLSGNAAGLGDCDMAQLLSSAGVRLFAVSRLDEAQRVASALPADAGIMLLTPYATEDEARRIVDLGLTAAVGSHESAVLLDGIAGAAGVKCKINLMFDTGLGYSGFSFEETDKAVQTVQYLKNIELAGCFTLLTDPTGADRKSAAAQLAAFDGCLTALKKADINPGMTFCQYHVPLPKRQDVKLDAVLAGEVLFGLGAPRKKLGIQRVCRFAAPVSELCWLPAGRSIGDFGRFRAKKPVRAAVIPVGHYDGIFLEKAKDSFRFGDIVRYRHNDFLLHFKKEGLSCEIGGKKAALIGAVGGCALAADVSSIDCAPGAVAAFDIDPSYVGADIERRYM